MRWTRPAATGSDWTRERWRALATMFAVLTVMQVSGCGAGQQAQTSQMAPAIPGVDADAGPIGLRDLLVPYRAGGYPAGSDVPLVVRVFSTDPAPVRVTRVVPGTGGSMLVTVRNIGLRTVSGSRSPTSQPLVVPAEGELALVPGSGPYLVAEHLATPMPYGAALPVRFTFSTGGSVEVTVPMAPPTYPVTGWTSAPSAHAPSRSGAPAKPVDDRH